MTFEGNFASLKNDESFSLGIRDGISKTAGVPIEHVTIADMRAGSIIVVVEILFPPEAEDSDVLEFIDTIQEEPGTLFSPQFIQDYGEPRIELVSSGTGHAHGIIHSPNFVPFRSCSPAVIKCKTLQLWMPTLNGGFCHCRCEKEQQFGSQSRRYCWHSRRRSRPPVVCRIRCIYHDREKETPTRSCNWLRSRIEYTSRISGDLFHPRTREFRKKCPFDLTSTTLLALGVVCMQL